MRTNLRFVARAMLCPSEVLPTPGGADQAQDGSAQLLDAMLHGQVLDDALLDLVQAKVVLVQHRFGLGDVLQDLGALLPRHLHQPVDVVADDRRLRRHRRHHLQLVEFGGGLLAGLLGHARLGDLLLQVRELVAALVHFAKFLLNGLHLLIQVVLALRLLHLRLDAAADALLDLQHIHLAFDGDQDVFQALANVQDLQDLLLLAELQGHVGGHGVGQATRVLDARQRRQHLRGHLLVQFHVLLELRDHRAAEHIHLALVVGLAIRLQA